MKKHYALLLAGILPLSILAQSSIIQYRDEAPNTIKPQKVDRTVDQKSSGTYFWSEDFANGFPAGWTTDDVSGLCPWKWTTNGSHGFWNGNSAATYDDPINSTTAANGFLISDIDSSNHFNFGQPSGTTYQYIATYFTTSAIDLSVYPSVKLEFEQYFRFNNNVALEVMVSNDSINWTTWTVEGNNSNNIASPDPDLVGINISSVAGSQSTVYIKIGWDARVYFWAIDDMRIVEAPANDIVINSYYYDEWSFDQSPDFATLEFSVYPSSQIRPLNFKSNFTNNGTTAQTNVTLTVDVVDDQNNSVFNGSSSLATLAPTSNDSLYVTGFTPSGTAGRYNVDFTISQDETDADPGNNSGMKWYEVSDYIFGRDTGAVDGQYDNQSEAYELGNWFNIKNNDEELFGIDVAIDDDSDVGTTIYGIIYDSNRDPIDETEEYEIQTGDLNAAGGSNYITLLFSSPVDLFQDEDYLVMVGYFGGADNLQVGTSGSSPAQTSLLWDTPTATWFYVTRTPMVRMNLNPSVGIEHIALGQNISLEQNFPNPFSGSSQISFEVAKSTNVALEVHDLTGKLVNYLDLGKVASGKHIMDIPADELSDGVYFYSLVTDEQSITKRMVVLNSNK